MVNGIGTTNLNFSQINGMTALNAFRADEKTVQKAKQPEKEPEINEILPNEKLRNEISFQKADEIKQFGQLFDINISNSDINYAFTYGRSVIVDYKA